MGTDQLELLGVLPEHARSDMPAVIAGVPTARPPEPTVAVPASAVEVAVDGLAPDEPPSASGPAGSHPSVAPGGDVEAWGVLDEDDPVPGTSPHLHVIAGQGQAPASSAMTGMRQELTAMHRDGLAEDPTPPPNKDRFTAAVRAGRVADAGPVAAVAQSLLDEVPPATPDPEPPGVGQDHPSASDPFEEVVASAADPAPAAGVRPPSAPAAGAGEDFGPLLGASAPSRRTRTAPPAEQPRTHRPRPAVRWVLAAVAVLVVGVLVVLAVSRFSSAPADPGSVSAASWRDWRGISLPVSDQAGPAVWEGDQVSGFARSPLGAAIAGAHLSVRVDPSVGEQVWGPVLATQVVGDRDRLAAALAAQAPSAGADPGQPGQLTGWRVDGDLGTGAVVAHLAVRAADGTSVDYGIPVAWTGTDWALDVPASGAVFSVGDTNGPYTDFSGVDGDY